MDTVTLPTCTARLLSALLLPLLLFVCCQSQPTRNLWAGPIPPGSRFRLNYDTGNAFYQQWGDSEGRIQSRYGWRLGPPGSSHVFFWQGFGAGGGDTNVLPTPEPEPSIYPDRYVPRTRPSEPPRELKDDAEDEGNYRNALDDFAGPGGVSRPGGFVGLPLNRLNLDVGPIGVNTVLRASASAPTAQRLFPPSRNSGRSLLS
ncbi:hypothetical protein HPB47_010420 [Ixodes persulcatus]|uniref:Uncharacterized protein n=1 Tax=Ixodes persulcatus TaxID=34615 RepID=A0AC60NZ55_IXOPE|nr:hypothetical protein HPB47_010420 [Ixodes persulcatus]